MIAGALLRRRNLGIHHLPFISAVFIVRRNDRLFN
jgi:hypothetical protein